jgi:hypothetical protein
MGTTRNLFPGAARRQPENLLTNLHLSHLKPFLLTKALIFIIIA